MDEESAVIAWAVGLLMADSAVVALVTETLPGPPPITRIGVYDSIVPQNLTKQVGGSNPSYLVLHSQAFTEIGSAINGELGAATMLLAVQVVTQSAGFVKAGAILKAAHTVLQNKTGSGNGVVIQSCIRSSKIPRRPESREGITRQMLGNLYRLTLSYS